MRQHKSHRLERSLPTRARARITHAIWLARTAHAIRKGLHVIWIKRLHEAQLLYVCRTEICGCSFCWWLVLIGHLLPQGFMIARALVNSAKMENACKLNEPHFGRRVFALCGKSMAWCVCSPHLSFVSTLLGDWMQDDAREGDGSLA